MRPAFRSTPLLRWPSTADLSASGESCSEDDRVAAVESWPRAQLQKNSLKFRRSLLQLLQATDIFPPHLNVIHRLPSGRPFCEWRSYAAESHPFVPADREALSPVMARAKFGPTRSFLDFRFQKNSRKRLTRAAQSPKLRGVLKEGMSVRRVLFFRNIDL